MIFNVNRQIEAKNKNDEFGKEFFKLMNNSCYGQMMMNERDFKRGKFCRGRKKGISQKKLALSNPRCVDWYDLDNESYFVLFDQMNTITKPLACGVSVLGISKSYMISFWYKLLDKFGPDSIHLISTDTDSLIFELSGKNYKEADIFSYIREDPNFAEWFDLSDVPNVRREAPADNAYWSLKNKGVMGKFKFEVLGIGEICAICPKMNSILTVDDEDHIKTKLTGKGIDNCCIDDDSTMRSKKVEEKEGGVIEMKKKMKDGTHKDRTMIRHANMKDCVLHGMKGDDVEVWRIETISNKMDQTHTRWSHENISRKR